MHSVATAGAARLCAQLAAQHMVQIALPMAPLVRRLSLASRLNCHSTAAEMSPLLPLAPRPAAGADRQ